MMTNRCNKGVNTFKQITHSQSKQQCPFKGMDFAKCSTLNRLFSCLRKYTLLQIKQSYQHNQIFEHFINNNYNIKQLLDDYNELISCHSDYLQEINLYLVEQKSFQKCDDIKHCQYSNRHHRVNDNQYVDNEEEKKSSAIIELYCDTLDSLHFYLFHLCHIGLRSMKTENETDSQKQEKKYEDEYFDASFSRIRSYISSTRHRTALMKRFPNVEDNKNNNHVSKFSININNRNNCSKNQLNISKNGKVMTYLDDIYQNLTKSKIDEKIIIKLINYVNDEEFCTESIDFDVNEIGVNGNISKHVHNKKCISSIIRFMTSSRSMWFSFCFLSLYMN